MIRFRFVVFLFFCSSIVIAQKHDNIWLFGGDGGDMSPLTDSGGVSLLDFSLVDRPLIQNLQYPKVFFYGTNASICDSSGNLLFYTNGEQVYNRNHQKMINGNEITVLGDGYGYFIPQGAMALPFPGHFNQYILLTIEHDPGPAQARYLFYHKIDMSLNGGLGQVIEKRKILIQDALAGGKITATKHANGRDWWFIVPAEYSKRYYIGLLSPAGIQVDTFENNVETADGLGQAIFSPDGSKYIRTDDKNLLTPNQLSIFDFDRCDGTLSNFRTTFLTDENTYGIGCVVSPNSKYLYVNNTLVCYQYDLTSQDIFATKVNVATWDGTKYYNIWPTDFYLGQLGPDGRIYINTTNGSNSIHYINSPNEYGSECAFIQNGLPTPTIIQFEMPNFPNYRLGPLDGSSCDTLNFDNHPLCNWRWEQTDTLNPLQIRFVDLSDYEPSSWYWDFGDGATSQDVNPSHSYLTEGIYNVCLIISNNYSSDTLCRLIKLLSTKIEAPESSVLAISPNPATDLIYIEGAFSSDSYPILITLFDVNGKECLKAQLKCDGIPVPVSSLPDGVYFCRIQDSSNAPKSLKLVVSHN